MQTVATSTGRRQSTAHDNSFDALRLGAALAVVIGHGFVLTGQGPAPKIGGLPIHALGVDVFFVISGYLISDSWLRDPHLGRYFARRLLRIMPALACVVLLTVLIIGPMLTTKPIDQYWTSVSTWAYLQNLALIGVYDLPGVFQHGHWTTAVNGCLWTLGLEFTGYSIIALGTALPRRRATVPMVALLLISTALVLSHGTDTGFGAAGRVWIYFALGALARHHFPRSAYKPVLALPTLLVWLVAGVLSSSVGGVLAWLVVPYLSLTLGHSRAVPTPVFRTLGDVSYGTYLWGFLVQQVVIERFGNLPVPLDLTVVATCTLGLAWLSWHNIEARALHMKPHSSRRPDPKPQPRPLLLT